MSSLVADYLLLQGWDRMKCRIKETGRIRVPEELAHVIAGQERKSLALVAISKIEFSKETRRTDFICN